jgi:queuine tRNA-ribosyltransferase
LVSLAEPAARKNKIQAKLSRMDFRFEVLKTDPTGARLGRITTPHGVIDTPAFMPVGTAGTVKGLTQQALCELGVQILLGNTYHLYLRPGHERIRRLGGLHRFMAWDGSILTDSGGFQVFSLADLRKVTDDGALFRSHLDGSEHFLTPEKSIEIQQALGSDIAMVLDECIEFPADHARAADALKRTTAWARRCRDYARANAAGSMTPGQVLFGIVQGGMHADLRRESAHQLVDLDFPGYAVGGLAVGEPHAISCEMAAAATAELPADRPRYVMGVGLPEQLPDYVARGVDMMDCVLPTRNARNGCLFTSAGRINIKNAIYADDPRPLDEQCACMVCRTYSRAYLRHLFQANEILASILNSHHNVAFFLDIMSKIRQAIAFGELAAFSTEFQARMEAGQP